MIIPAVLPGGNPAALNPEIIGPLEEKTLDSRPEALRE